MKILTFLLAPALLAQIPTFKSEVSVVKVDVRVMPGEGKPSGVLTKEDFAVYDEGVPQTINYFGRENEPLNLVLVLDVSDSMRQSLSAVARSTREALGVLGADDQVAVVLYASRSMLAQPFTKDRAAIREAILSNMFKQTLGRDTMVNDGLLTAIEAFRGTPADSRRAILVITDNLGGAASASQQQVQDALLKANIVVNAVVIPPSSSGGLAASDVRPFVEKTGGEMMTTSNASTAFRDLLDRIRARYTFQYAMPPGEAGKFRRIRVELSDIGKRKYPGAKLLAREGYFLPN